ncbi:MAG: glycine--tRNA ligase subunit beta [Synergistaceae bacterium]|jgi:glycyl-tRNA synthetase beta chain|nr:glycine--tRNA ligase subunit beta [Synergistaceae bacterium]
MILRDLLFEIGTEEIPARFMTWAITELERMAAADLADLRVGYGKLKVTGTPRRIVLYAEDVAENQEGLEETVKGPPKTQALDGDGKFTPSALGFAKSRGADVSDLRFEEVKGVEYLFAVTRKSGKKTVDVLPDFLEGLLKKLVFPKNMYWNDPKVRFARPVRWIVALWDGELVPVSFGRVASGYGSRGHRFMGAPRVDIPIAKDYWSIMEREFVIVDCERRKRMILDGISAIEKETGGAADEDPELLEENAQLVEFPVPFLGSFEREFLDIPEEVLIATMKKNQRYFPIRDANGRLAPVFIGVSNNRAKDMSVVRDGNERVLRARLHDAAFFWKEDLQKPLESRLPQLEKLLYQERLGSIRDKSERVRSLASKVVGKMGWNEIAADVERAARLSKADLVTAMVFEFPEVQGVMGREYAKKGGENDAVANAVFEQYLPRFAGDELPKGREGAVIGVCDRADTIVAIHKVGLSPTGSQDPYGLRRAARCINEIAWGLEFDIDLEALFLEDAVLLDADSPVMDKVFSFYKNRLHNQLRERGHDHGAASLAVASQWGRPLQALRMLQAFDEVAGADWFASLVLSAVRVANILGKLPPSEAAEVKLERALLSEQAESSLLAVLDKQSGIVGEALSKYDWKAVCEALADLSPAISGFFSDVMVMADDATARNNRLALLVMCKELFDSIGDFSLIRKR